MQTLALASTRKGSCFLSSNASQFKQKVPVPQYKSISYQESTLMKSFVSNMGFDCDIMSH